MLQLGWKVDSNACISCRACEMACKVEYDIKAGQGRRRRVIEKTLDEAGVVRTFFLSLACNQCENPACIAACPKSRPVGVGTASNSALWKDMTGSSSGGVVGVVRVEPTKCIGCRRCEWACPYGAPQFNPEGLNAYGVGGPRGVIHKCEMCWQRIADTALHSSRRCGACVATCLGQAIKQAWVDTDPTAAYSNTSKDTDAVPIQTPNAALGTQTYTPGQSDFASPGTALSHAAGRGTAYVAEANMTRPALKIRNRVYVNRSGSGVV